MPQNPNLPSNLESAIQLYDTNTELRAEVQKLMKQYATIISELEQKSKTYGKEFNYILSQIQQLISGEVRQLEAAKLEALRLQEELKSLKLDLNKTEVEITEVARQQFQDQQNQDYEAATKTNLKSEELDSTELLHLKYLKIAFSLLLHPDSVLRKKYPEVNFDNSYNTTVDLLYKNHSLQILKDLFVQIFGEISLDSTLDFETKIIELDDGRTTEIIWRGRQWLTARIENDTDKSIVRRIVEVFNKYSSSELTDTQQQTKSKLINQKINWIRVINQLSHIIKFLEDQLDTDFDGGMAVAKNVLNQEKQDILNKNKQLQTEIDYLKKVKNQKQVTKLEALVKTDSGSSLTEKQQETEQEVEAKRQRQLFERFCLLLDQIKQAHDNSGTLETDSETGPKIPLFQGHQITELAKSYVLVKPNLSILCISISDNKISIFATYKKSSYRLIIDSQFDQLKTSINSQSVINWLETIANQQGFQYQLNMKEISGNPWKNTYVREPYRSEPLIWDGKNVRKIKTPKLIHEVENLNLTHLTWATRTQVIEDLLTNMGINLPDLPDPDLHINSTDEQSNL